MENELCQFKQRKPTRLREYDYSSNGLFLSPYNIRQRSYHDRIIRNDEKYREIHAYIKGNPIV